MLTRLLATTLIIGATHAVAAAPTARLTLKLMSATVRGQAIADAEVVFQKEGQAPVSGVSDASGRVSVPNSFGVDDASVTMTVKKPGYSPLITECPCNGLSYALSSTLGQDHLESIRVVLNWGAEPPYLDLHAVYPGNHVYWNARIGSDAALDVRAEDAFGPATITVQKRHAGEQYVFAVHNWSADGKHGNSKLSASRARVFVYVGDSLVKSYKVPTGKTGAMWVLFAVDGDGAFHDVDNIVDITELDSVRPYLKQLSERTNFGLPMHVSEEDLKRAEALFMQGQAAFQAESYDTAIRAYQKAIELHPSDVVTVTRLAETYSKLGRTAEAQWANRKVEQLKKLPKASGYRVPNASITVEASSHLRPWKHYTFDPLSLLDDNLWTSWQPNRKPAGGVGEWFKLAFSKPEIVTGFEISNGFRLIDELGDLYQMNNRIKDAVLQFSDGSELPIHLEDIANDTTILLPEPKETRWVKLTVKSIYKGSKWNDLAVSEFHALGTSK